MGGNCSGTLETRREEPKGEGVEHPAKITAITKSGDAESNLRFSFISIISPRSSRPPSSAYTPKPMPDSIPAVVTAPQATQHPQSSTPNVALLGSGIIRLHFRNQRPRKNLCVSRLFFWHPHCKSPAYTWNTRHARQRPFTAFKRMKPVRAQRGNQNPGNRQLFNFCNDHKICQS